MKEKIKNKNAITLLALIITVIILLILTTVSISLIINSGILDHAQQGVDKYSEEEELEQIKLAVASAMLKGNGFLTTENLNSELQDKIDENEEAEKRGANWYYKEYIIAENGNVEKNDQLLPKEYQEVEYIEGTDGKNRTKIEVLDEIGINSRKLYVEALVVYIPEGNSDNLDRSIIFSTGSYGECCTSFYRQASEYVAIYSGSSKSFPTYRYNSIIENEIATITPSNAKVGNIEINIETTNNAEKTYNSFVCASGIGKFGYVNIYEIGNKDEKIIRHKLIPCIDKNSIPCMYDMITKKVLYNKGIGDYIAGPTK